MLALRAARCLAPRQPMTPWRCSTSLRMMATGGVPADQDAVLKTVDSDGFAIVTLNRGEAFNTFSETVCHLDVGHSTHHVRLIDEPTPSLCR